jgi:anti-sigma factor RsiW
VTDAADLDRLLARLFKEGHSCSGPEDHPALEKLSAYNAGELSPEESDAIQEHFAGCDLCAELLLDLQRFLSPVADNLPDKSTVESTVNWQEMREMGAGEKPRQVRRLAFSSLGLAYRIAAVLAVAGVGLSTYALKLQHELEQRGPQILEYSISLSSQGVR